MTAADRMALVFSRTVVQAQERGLRAPRGPVRWMLLTSIFRAMPAQLDRKRAASVEGVIEWRILNRRGNRTTVWSTEIVRGRCIVRRGATESPRTTLEMSTGDFIALASGNASAPTLLFSGRMKLGGDMMFAAGLPAMFGMQMGA